MMLIGVDYHPSFQTIAFVMEETGECGEQELQHSDGQAEKYYRDLKHVSSLGQSAPARVVGAVDRMNPTIEELTAAAEREARKRPTAQRLMTHPGVGPLTALAFVLIIGTWERFPRDKQISNYVGMIPSEDSSAGKQRLGHISKQGNSLLRFLLVEAAQAAARCNPDWRRRYIHLAMRRHKSIAKVAMGRRMAVRLYWMWRNGIEYSPSLEFGSYAGQLGTGHGVK
jgi:transposase